MQTYQGVHATTASRMQSIQATGFTLSEEGRRGTGVYFWSVSPYSDRICALWYTTWLQQGHYKDDADKRQASIEADLECSEAEFFDLETYEFKSLVTQICASQGLTRKEAKENERLTKLYEVCIEMVEKAKGTKFLILKASLGVPSLFDQKWYPLDAIGNPIALIVRDLRGIKGQLRPRIN